MYLLANDKSLAVKLIEIFKSEWPQLLIGVKKAIQTKNSKDLEAHSHRIRGNVRNFYADGISHLAAQFEERGKKGVFDNLEKEVGVLETNLKDLEAELEKYMREKLV